MTTEVLENKQALTGSACYLGREEVLLLQLGLGHNPLHRLQQAGDLFDLGIVTGPERLNLRNRSIASKLWKQIEDVTDMLNALRRTLWAHDGRIPWTGLLSSLFAKFRANPHAIVRWMSRALPRDFATLAPAIVEYASTNDLIAVELLRLAGWHIDALAQRLLALGVDRLSLAGSLSASIEPCLAEGTRRHLVAPLGDAVAGALQLARDAAELVSDRAVSRRP